MDGMRKKESENKKKTKRAEERGAENCLLVSKVEEVREAKWPTNNAHSTLPLPQPIHSGEHKVLCSEEHNLCSIKQ